MRDMASTLTAHRNLTMAHFVSVSAKAALGIFLLMTPAGCRQPARNPVTLIYFRPGWRQLDPTWEIVSRQFTRETGVQIRDLPTPESTLDQLNLSRKLLQENSSGPDVLGVDLIWSGALGEDLIDLHHYLATEM